MSTKCSVAFPSLAPTPTPTPAPHLIIQPSPPPLFSISPSSSSPPSTHTHTHTHTQRVGGRGSRSGLWWYSYLTITTAKQLCQLLQLVGNMYVKVLYFLSTADCYVPITVHCNCKNKFNNDNWSSERSICWSLSVREEGKTECSWTITFSWAVLLSTERSVIMHICVVLFFRATATDRC